MKKTKEVIFRTEEDEKGFVLYFKFGEDDRKLGWQDVKTPFKSKEEVDKWIKGLKILSPKLMSDEKFNKLTPEERRSSFKYDVEGLTFKDIEEAIDSQ